MSDVTVRGCAECPFMTPEFPYYCSRPEAPNEDLFRLGLHGEGKPPPTWCPLRAGPLVVRLEVQRGE